MTYTFLVLCRNLKIPKMFLSTQSMDEYRILFSDPYGIWSATFSGEKYTIHWVSSWFFPRIFFKMGLVHFKVNYKHLLGIAFTVAIVVLSADCTPTAEISWKLSLHLRKWERCDLGGKHRARYCHLLLAPPSRLTPNQAKGGSLYKRVSMAPKLF